MVEPQRLPKRLARDTIYEAVFEMRFSSDRPAISSIMPGLLYSKLTDLFASSQELPIASMPQQMRDLNPLLLYQPTHALLGDNIRFNVGPRSVAISMSRPYAGWVQFKNLIQKCIKALLETPFVGVVERCSIKYTNLLSEGQHINDLGQLKAQVQLDGFDLHNAVTAVKTEIALGGCTNIIQIMTGSTIRVATITPIEASGVLVDVDTIKIGPFGDFKSHLSDLLDQVHDTEKQIFFGLLTTETLNKLGPEW